MGRESERGGELGLCFGKGSADFLVKPPLRTSLTRESLVYEIGTVRSLNKGGLRRRLSKEFPCCAYV